MSGQGFPAAETAGGEGRQNRWTSYYIVLYSDDGPTHLGIFGFSETRTDSCC